MGKVADRLLISGAKRHLSEAIRLHESEGAGIEYVRAALKMVEKLEELAGDSEESKLLLQVDELRKHLDKLVAEGNRCLEIPEFWDDGLSDALDEAITYLDGTEKPITEKRVEVCQKCGKPGGAWCGNPCLPF